LEAREQELGLSLNAAVVRIGPRVGINEDTLRGWCKHAEIDSGRRPGVTTSEASRIKELERENAFTAFVSDVFSRRIVGWRTSSSIPTELPLDALEMALWTRDQAGQPVRGLVHHSDAGSQYTSIRYSTRLDDAGAVASIGTVGDSYDNAMAESVIGLYKRECIRHDGPFRTVDELELATLSWVDWWNQDRAELLTRATASRRSSVGYLAGRPTRASFLRGLPQNQVSISAPPIIQGPGGAPSLRVVRRGSWPCRTRTRHP
jgi:transposase InsO family protein